jgi:crossover junction endodeoxyribonuclease RuvC
MHTKHTKILAIDPGTREIGVAVLEGEALVYYGVKTIRNRKRPQQVLGEASRIVKRLIEDYQPSVLAIEKMFLIQKNASLLIVVADEIKATAQAVGLAVYEYSPTTVRKRICQTGKATKRAVAGIIASRYLELARYLKGKSKWEELYYANMFDAIAVGLACYQQIVANHFTASQNFPDLEAKRTL